MAEWLCYVGCGHGRYRLLTVLSFVWRCASMAGHVRLERKQTSNEKLNVWVIILGSKKWIQRLSSIKWRRSRILINARVWNIFSLVIVVSIFGNDQQLDCDAMIQTYSTIHSRTTLFTQKPNMWFGLLFLFFAFSSSLHSAHAALFAWLWRKLLYHLYWHFHTVCDCLYLVSSPHIKRAHISTTALLQDHF